MILFTAAGSENSLRALEWGHDSLKVLCLVMLFTRIIKEHVFSMCCTCVWRCRCACLGMSWIFLCRVCDPASARLGSLTNACVCLCCRLICWQKGRAYELYSVLISTLHSDHYIRFLWWRLIALSRWGGWSFTDGGAPHTYSTHTHFSLTRPHTHA